MSELQMLRIEVAGEWYAYEWANLLNVVDKLYVDFAILGELEQLTQYVTIPPDPSVSSRIESLVEILNSEPENRRPFSTEEPSALRVAAIKYGSDGQIDLVGIGRALESVEKMLKDLLSHAGNSAKRDAAVLKNIQTELDMYRKLGHTDEEVKAYFEFLIARHRRGWLQKFIDGFRIKKVLLLPAPQNWENRRLLPPPAPA